MFLSNMLRTVWSLWIVEWAALCMMKLMRQNYHLVYRVKVLLKFLLALCLLAGAPSVDLPYFEIP